MEKDIYICTFCNPNSPCTLELVGVADNYTPDRCPISEDDEGGCNWEYVETVKID
jgi:hypothetical protein